MTTPDEIAHEIALDNEAIARCNQCVERVEEFVEELKAHVDDLENVKKAESREMKKKVRKVSTGSGIRFGWKSQSRRPTKVVVKVGP